MIEVFFNDVEISKKISINSCYHDMYCEGRADTLNLKFNDAENEWDKWSPKVGDYLSVKYGSINTGTMFVESVNPENGLYNIIATSIPPTSKEVKSKAWQKVFFKQIGEEIAKNHNLEFKSYSIDDILYDYILQNNENDFSFLQKICRLEGCAFLIYDKTLVLYKQQYLENIEPIKTITLTSDSDYHFFDNSARLYGFCKLEKGIYKGEFIKNSDIKRGFVPDLKVPINIFNETQANRYAQNLLRDANKKMIKGHIYSRIMPEFAPGSTFNLENYKAPSWNGACFITHIRNDYAKGLSKIFFRKPLDY